MTIETILLSFIAGLIIIQFAVKQLDTLDFGEIFTRLIIVLIGATILGIIVYFLSSIIYSWLG